jgi:F-type H+-transporting ATPase subunit epsilon
MMAKTFRLEVITPDRTVFTGDVVQLKITGEDGGMGILVNHAPMVAVVATGPARLDFPDGSNQWLMLGDGFLEVRDNQVKVLAEVGEKADEIDLPRAEAAERRALERLKAAGVAEVDFARARAALTRAMTRLKILRDLSPSKSRGRGSEQPRF